MGARPQMTLLVLLSTGTAFTHASKSSYAELIEEDQQGLSQLEKNARTFVRNVEHRIGRKLTEEEMRNGYASKIEVFRALEKKHDGKELVQAIRDWVRSVTPMMNQDSGGIKYDTHGPLHLVLQAASEIVGRDHADDNHPYREAKQIVVGMREFTQEIVKYYRHRERSKDEL